MAKRRRVCWECGTLVRTGTGGEYHVVPGYPEIETIAQKTCWEDELPSYVARSRKVATVLIGDDYSAARRL